MSDSVRRIRGELESLGYCTSEFDSPYGRVICFPYTVDTGPQEGRNYILGFSLHGAEYYPEYPPHWIHLSPPFDDGKGGVKRQYCDSENREWIALSRPPNDIWDRLPTKNMYAYMNEHVRRFWGHI